MASKLEYPAPSLTAVGAAVIAQEADGLVALAKSLDDRFRGAVEAIAACRGRVVVTGLGKSGHVGRKISSTLASTGSPSFFLHAAEAGHGDLGMLSPSDVLLVLSNSGETAEIKPIVARALQIGVSVIAIASRPRSYLVRSATFPLMLPDVEEACPHGTAPTSSTTMMMALGDALAVAAMEARGTTIEDIARFHPSGTIGSRLAPVESLLPFRGRLPRVAPDAPMSEAVFEMTSAGRGAVCVVDGDGLLAGIITDGDVRRSIDRIADARCIDVMTRDPLTVREGMTRQEAYHIMHDNRVNVLVVVSRDDARRPLGIVHIHDIELIA
ncbi:KpsF/GutQ family sugar-phosphate isomerase [Sphingomonas sp. GlSt437]|uniref:KpsF/GutQ family sugar-phosphate isomerase n=1 Tax=Sphingomonas sp. GlSt437 TaxID=3389970 RepID=UPI003A8C3FD3